MNSDAPASRGKMLALLRPGPFRRYIIGSVISDTGTWMQVMAQGWLISTLTNKAILLGMVEFCRRNSHARAHHARGFSCGQIRQAKNFNLDAICPNRPRAHFRDTCLHRRIHVWHVVVVAAFLGVCIAFEMPAINALVPELVKRDESRLPSRWTGPFFTDRVWLVLRSREYLWRGGAPLPLFLRMPDRFSLW